MDYVIVAFRSRTHTMRFAEELRRRGVPAEIVNTPRRAYVGCGLSVKVSARFFPFVKRLDRSLGFDSFAGFFAYGKGGGLKGV